MTKRLLEVDPDTGIKTWFEYDRETDVTTLTTTQDVEPHIELAKALAKDDDYTKQGIKKGWWHYAFIPDGVIAMLFAKGINVYDPNDTKKVFQEINQNYPVLKTTPKHHE